MARSSPRRLFTPSQPGLVSNCSVFSVGAAAASAPEVEPQENAMRARARAIFFIGRRSKQVIEGTSLELPSSGLHHLKPAELNAVLAGLLHGARLGLGEAVQIHRTGTHFVGAGFEAAQL